MERTTLQHVGALVQWAKGASGRFGPFSKIHLDKIQRAVEVDLTAGPTQPLWDRIRSIICDPYAELRLSGDNLKALRKLLMKPGDSSWKVPPLCCSKCKKELSDSVESDGIGMVICIYNASLFCSTCFTPVFACSSGHVSQLECPTCQSQSQPSSKPLPTDPLARARTIVPPRRAQRFTLSMLPVMGDE